MNCELNILYEDNHLIAVYKPAGVLVQGDNTGDATLMNKVKDYLKEKYQKPGNIFLGLLHRLDRPVSGIILFAKTSKGASRLSEQFRNRTVEKIYHCLVEGSPKKKKDELAHYLKKDEKINKVSVCSEKKLGYQIAELSYNTVETHRMRLKPSGQASLLQIRLGTGRPHQIRAQMSAIGHPIVGDVKYGASAPLSDKSIALAATSLTFKTATTGETKTIKIKIPDEWKKYF